MPDYRRRFVAGGCFFFTVNLLDRRSDLLVRHVDLLRDVVRGVRRERPFGIDAWVVLPEHMHCVWTLPDGDADYPGRWRAIKKGFSRALPGVGAPTVAMERRGERGVWQRRYWEHAMRDEADWRAHVDYVHFNPVKHGYVAHPADWAHSSFRRCVAAGMYPADWGGVAGALVEAGER